MKAAQSFPVKVEEAVSDTYSIAYIWWSIAVKLPNIFWSLVSSPGDHCKSIVLLSPLESLNRSSLVPFLRHNLINETFGERLPMTVQIASHTFQKPSREVRAEYSYMICHMKSGLI